MVGSIFGFLARWTHKVAINPAKMAILGPNLKNDVPKTSEWASLAQYSSFQCQQQWWGPFFYFFGALRTHKMAIKPVKMAILGPNLKNAVPKTSEWAKLTQYSTFQCQQ